MASVYGDITDLDVGDISVLDDTKTRHVNNAADEIDSRLGFMYQTPFTVSNTSDAGWKLIQRLARFVASGRLLMEIAQASENQMVQAYAKRLLDDAEAAFALILEGKVNLSPATPSDPGSSVDNQNAVTVTNLDPYSQVEAFYGWAALPPGTVRYGGGWGAY